jgi:N-acetylglucosamine malate deacetylase 1
MLHRERTMTAGSERTIMAVGAHHDDNEVFAGTLIRYRRAGWRIVSVVMTNGVYIGGRVSDEHIAIRERESLHAAEMVGAEAVFLRLPEGNLRRTRRNTSMVIDVVRKYVPSIVLTHPPRDYHFDHMNTSRIVRDAMMLCAGPGVACETQDQPCPTPALYYTDAWFVPFVPDQYVDVSDVIELKLQALACHESQLDPARPLDGGMIEMARVQSRYRGIEAGVAYAEAFRMVSRLGGVRLGKQLLNP